MRLIITLALLALGGCMGFPKGETLSWPLTPRGHFQKPTEEESSRAEQIGRQFAVRRLGVSLADAEIMQVHVSRCRKDGVLALEAEFIDPGFYFEKLDGGRVKGMTGPGPRCLRV